MIGQAQNMKKSTLKMIKKWNQKHKRSAIKIDRIFAMMYVSVNFIFSEIHPSQDFAVCESEFRGFLIT